MLLLFFLFFLFVFFVFFDSFLFCFLCFYIFWGDSHIEHESRPKRRSVPPDINDYPGMVMYKEITTQNRHHIDQLFYNRQTNKLTLILWMAPPVTREWVGDEGEG